MTSSTHTSQRIDELLAEMTTTEKAGQLVQYFYRVWPDSGGSAVQQAQAVEQALAHGGAGALLFVSDPAVANRLQRQAIDGSRQGIPAMFGFDVIHGLRTILPVPIALAASWDPDMIERAQAVAAREARAVGIHWTFAPMVDIARDARWGRMIEGAGEDPFLGSMVAAAQVRGFQGDHMGAPEHVIAGPKHFVGYGAALGGRDYDEVDLSDQELWNTYLPPFQAAIEAGAGNIMCAYQDVNGVPATGNRWLLHEILRESLGFEGFVVSDFSSVQDLVTHHFAADLADAGARALDAGVDLEIASSNPAFGHLVGAVESGRIPMARLDASVRRVLAAKEALGLFENPFVDESAARAVLSDPAHRDVAREAAERSAVLLRNDGDLLPLSVETVGTIAVLGPLADSARDTLGPWVFDYDLDETVTVLEGIRHHVGDRAQVTHAAGVAPSTRRFPSMFEEFGEAGPPAPTDFDVEAELSRSTRLAAAADVAVLVLGEWQDMIGENASRSALSLPGDQPALLRAVVATGTPTVLVLLNGRPLDLRLADQHVQAILDAWYPGTQGGAAVANLLFGEATPGGKLPFTWPRTVGQVPLHYATTRSHQPQNQGRRYWDEQSTPLYPFGYGLSYAHFRYSALTLDTDEVGLDGTVTVSVEVSNTAERGGDEVVQLYLHQRHGTSSRPRRLLKAFRRVHVPAGGTTTVEFVIGPDERRYWSAATREWTIDATVFDVWVGGDSTATSHAQFTVR